MGKKKEKEKKETEEEEETELGARRPFSRVPFDFLSLFSVAFRWLSFVARLGRPLAVDKETPSPPSYRVVPSFTEFRSRT